MPLTDWSTRQRESGAGRTGMPQSVIDVYSIFIYRVSISLYYMALYKPSETDDVPDIVKRVDLKDFTM